MGFLVSHYDLTFSVFTQEDLTTARNFLKIFISKYSPNWMAKPKGPVGKWWLSNNSLAACNLIQLGMDWYILNNNNVTQMSFPNFIEKVKFLLEKVPEGDKFEERLTEFQVAAHLVQRVSPIAFEPTYIIQNGSEPEEFAKRIDFAVKLDQETIPFEVTVFRSERVMS
jgi:hypothetical protein